jgi:hypothetical protein
MKPIKDFEQDYALTDKGEVIDIHTGKVKLTHVRGSIPEPRVDLYKDGVLLLNIRVIELIIKQYSEVGGISHYDITYFDGDPSNLSFDNLQITNKPNSYVPKISVSKPQKVMGLTMEGFYIKNQSDIDQIRRINFESSIERQKLSKPKSTKKYQKFLKSV